MTLDEAEVILREHGAARPFLVRVARKDLFDAIRDCGFPDDHPLKGSVCFYDAHQQGGPDIIIETFQEAT
jgi:hypothetical protein